MQNPLFFIAYLVPLAVDAPLAVGVHSQWTFHPQRTFRYSMQMRHLCFGDQSGNKIVKFDDFPACQNLSGEQQLCRFPFL